MRNASRIALLGFGAILIAGAAGAQTSDQRIRVSKDGPIAAVVPGETRTVGGTTTSVSGPGRTVEAAPQAWEFAFTPFDLSAYAGLTEPQILSHMATVDSMQYALAQIAVGKLGDANARGLAERISSEYRANFEELGELVKDEGVEVAPLASDPEAERLRQAIRKFQLMPAGPAYDAAYLRFQIAHHENEHEVLSRNQGNTRDNDFDDLIDDWLEDLKERRNQAVMIVSGMP